MVITPATWFPSFLPHNPALRKILIYSWRFLEKKTKYMMQIVILHGAV